MSIVVAVRVRPFNQREKDLKTKLCVKMRGNTTILVNESGGERKFTFDHSFWSHDGFKTEKDGTIVPKSDKFADQALVYDKVGRQILSNALRGYHCCLFAYGQTGSGKSYSMIGYGVNRGIVPIISEQIFIKAKELKSETRSFSIRFSMLEIYNEKVQDLMARIEDRPKGGLKVRESKKHGVFVDKLSKHAVTSYEEIEEKMSEGNKNRTIAATQMNSSSSRAHTIIAIELTQKEIIYGNVTEKFSVINLVDLAGSEKVAKTGATGDRLKEGSMINKSLTVLGMVISALADIAMGKKNKVVPYRNSALTRILQNALGGNSKTLMICAVSPSSDNYDETLSTLRYADQAKKIKCHAMINESPKDKMIRELKEENERLKKQLKNFKGPVGGGGNEGAEQNNDELEKRNKEFEKQILDLQQKLLQAEKAADQFRENGTEVKFKEQEDKPNRRVSMMVERNENHAHLVNINEDPFLSNKIFHDIDKLEKITIGRKSPNKNMPNPVISLASIGIEYNHACVEKMGDAYFLYLNKDKEGSVFYNGQLVEEKIKLKHLDRIIFGTSAIFLFLNPHEPVEGEFQKEEIDYEFCQMEKHQMEGDNKEEDEFDLEKFKQINQEENEKLIQEKIKEATRQYEDKIQELENETTLLKEKTKGEKDQQNEEREKQRQEVYEHYQAYIEQLEKEMNRKDRLLEQQRDKKISNEAFNKMKEEEKKVLNRKLAKISPNITELNLIAKELKRHIHFSVHLNYFFVDFHDVSNYQNQKKYRITIKVENNELGYTYFWDMEKYANRYFMIKELLEKHFEDPSSIQELKEEEDPFFDYAQHHCYGQGFLKLLSIAYLLDNPIDLTIVGDSGQVGMLSVNLIPVNRDGEEIEEDDELFDEFVDDPTQLLGSRLDFKVVIATAEFTREDLVEPYVSYQLKVQDEETGELRTETFTSEKGSDNAASMDFKYSKQHTYSKVTQDVLEYLLQNNLCFEVYAAPKINKRRQSMQRLSVASVKKRKVE